MTFATVNLFFPLVLALHNIDEYSRYDDFASAYHLRLTERFTTRPVVRDAMLLLTIAIAVLDAQAYASRTAVLMRASEIAIFALLLNGFGHCALSLRRHTVIPGTLSAIVLVLPYSGIAITTMRTSLEATVGSLACDAILGAMTMPLAILFSLWTSYGLHRFWAAAQG